MLFTYKAKSNTGDITQGVMEAEDRLALAHDLRSHGNVPLSIVEKKENSLNQIFKFSEIFSGVKLTDLVVLTKNLSGMLKAGLSLARALSVLKKQTKNVKLNKILTTLEEEINSGGTLSSGLAKFPDVFSKLFVSMTKAGEESGNLAGALEDVGLNLEKSSALTKKIHGALIYPGVIMSAMVIIGILMFAFVVPTLAATFKSLGVKLPFATQVLVGVGTFLSQHLILTFLMLVVAVFAIMSLLRAPFMTTYIDYIVLRLPIVGNLTKELNTARTTRTMSSLLTSGVSITRALEITEDVVQNMYYKQVLIEAKGAVEKGEPFSKVFETNVKLYPIMVSEMISVGEETGKLSDMLLEIALFYEEVVENKTRNLSTIIEPVLMVFIGAGVGFFAISMISPLYSILNSIK